MAVQTNRGMTSENEMKDQDVAPVFNINAPKYGTVVPNRVFVGGITSATTEDDLNQLFSNYGKVVNAKIIVDRAGVSRGYGFVTFESDEEARRLQKDADNIVLKERKLNIAPAIKKVQPVYTRGYDPSSGPGSPSQYSSYIQRQNGVVSSYYMNSLTYFPQQAAQQSAPSMTPLPSNHVEPSVYPGNYPAMPQCNSPPSYQYGYPQQAPIFIPHYPFAIPQYDGCYQGEVQNCYAQPGMESNNQVAYPQYFVSQQHPEITYYQQPVPQELVYTQRTYDSSTVYFTEPKFDDSCEPSPTSPNQQSPGPPMLPPAPSLPPISEIDKPKARNDETPVVSLSKVYHDQNDDYQPNPRYKPHQGFKRKPPPRHENNNNNPDLTDKNRMNRYDKSRNVGQKPVRPMASQNRRPIHNPRPTNLFQYRNQSMQVPQFPSYYASRPYVNQSQTYYNQRKPFQRGKFSAKAKKYRDETEPEGAEDEDVCEIDQLTPPITPISPKQHDISESDRKDELIRSFENLKM